MIKNVFNQIISIDGSDTIDNIAAYTHMTTKELCDILLEVINKKEKYVKYKQY